MASYIKKSIAFVIVPNTVSPLYVNKFCSESLEVEQPFWDHESELSKFTNKKQTILIEYAQSSCVQTFNWRGYKDCRWARKKMFHITY